MAVKFASLYALKAAGRDKKFVIPCIFTLFNACCGFLALINMIEGNGSLAACYIIAAACMDALDGRIARALRSTSAIGTELDSLADAVSFCVAPAVLLYSTCCVSKSIAGIVILSGYLCAGLSRLARFNRAPSSSFFIGLPTPVAALCITQIVLYQEWLVRTCIVPIDSISLMITVLLSTLMVSRVPYPSFKKIKLSARMMFTAGCAGSVLCMICVYYRMPVSLVGISWYILMGWMLRARE